VPVLSDGVPVVNGVPVRGATRRAALALAGIVAAVLLAACADNSPGSGSTDSDPANSVRTAAPGESVSAEQIASLKIGILGQVATFNPLENIASGLYFNSNVVESLLRLDANGDLQPWLATGFEQTSDTVYEYTLREGVTFWDGTEMTSEDVKSSWDLRIEEDQPFFASVDTIETPDEYTVRVTLKQPDASWQFTPALFYSNVFQKKFYEENKETFGLPGTLVMATGPWQVDSLNPTTGAELSAYEDYWGGKPAIDEISVKSFAEDNSMALALRAGEIDLAPSVNGPRGFDAAAGGGTITTVPTCATTLFSMPTQTAPWDDVHVRRAVAHALDREDIIGATQGRAAGPLDTLISPILLESLASKEEVAAALETVTNYPHDPAKAELAESQIPDGFSGEVVVPASAAPAAQVIAAQLEEIGIDLEVKQVGDTEFTSALVGPPAERPVSVVETGACSPDPSWDDLFLGTLPDGEPSTLNVANYVPAEIDTLMDEGLATRDPQQRLDVYTAILQRLGEDVPYVPLYAEGNTYASNDYDIVEYDSYWVNEPWALNVVAE
jgi:peptide/nickel transport system substrate-binding protein